MRSIPLQIDTLRLGSVQIVPFIGFNTPHAHVILNNRDGGVLTSQTSVEGELPGTHFRMYAESVGDFQSGATRTSEPITEVEPIDLLQSAGPAVAKRFAPLALGVLVVLLLLHRRSRRKRRPGVHRSRFPANARMLRAASRYRQR